jgi:periplasmic protein TonB
MPADQVASYLQVLTPSAAYDTLPKFTQGYAPFYPLEEEQRNETGYALVEFEVLTDGTTRDIRGIRATSYACVKEAISAVRDWRFKPARKNGNPVPVRVRLPFTFQS